MYKVEMVKRGEIVCTYDNVEDIDEGILNMLRLVVKNTTILMPVDPEVSYIITEQGKS